MALTSLSAISPVDGRYRRVTKPLGPFFSEGALIRYRVMMEVEYFIALCEIPINELNKIGSGKYEELRNVYRNFSESDAQVIKAIEKTTNHDVKAVEYFLKEAFERLGLGAFKEFIHFGLTSQDINNTAMPRMLKDAWKTVLQPQYQSLTNTFDKKSREWQRVPMLARTHGQPASPTTLGKEMAVFSHRLKGQLRLLDGIPFSAKLGGATGNFNAHKAAYPSINWPRFADRLLDEKLGLARTPLTTQIEPYDDLAAFCHGVMRLNTILIDFARDFWTYISMEYFKQKIKKDEVGSSTMPHKVNPINFENGEGNLGVANALLAHLADKLPVSRLQRDLTDSTVTRNLGVPLAHSLIALKSLDRGIGKLLLNEEALAEDLAANWAVVTEGIQTILRREGYPNPYEALKSLTRVNETITQATLTEFIDGLDVSGTIKDELRQLTPHNYTGCEIDALS